MDQPAEVLGPDWGGGVGGQPEVITPSAGVVETGGGRLGRGEMVARCRRHSLGLRWRRVFGGSACCLVNVLWVPPPPAMARPAAAILWRCQHVSGGRRLCTSRRPLRGFKGRGGSGGNEW